MQMTEDEKYEIATLATEVDRKQRIYEAHRMMNTPLDSMERENAAIALAIAETEYRQALAALWRAQHRISNS